MKFTKSLFMYMRGEDVATMQFVLMELNEEYNFSQRKLNPTGYFGFDTVHLVRDFQNYFGLPATGTFDYQTYMMAETKHYSLLSSLQTPKSPAKTSSINDRKWW